MLARAERQLVAAHRTPQSLQHLLDLAQKVLSKMAYLQISILKQQPGILRVGPVGGRGPLAYEGLAQNALVLVAGTFLVAPLQGHLGNTPEGLLPDGQGG